METMAGQVSQDNIHCVYGDLLLERIERRLLCASLSGTVKGESFIQAWNPKNSREEAGHEREGE
jgi:hypothetical protein